MDDYEVVAEELSQLAEKMRSLQERLAEVERVNARLEDVRPYHRPCVGRGLTSLGRGVRRYASRRPNRRPDLAERDNAAALERRRIRARRRGLLYASHRAGSRCESVTDDRVIDHS